MNKDFTKQRGQVQCKVSSKCGVGELAKWVGVLALKHEDLNSDSQYLLEARCNGVYQNLSAQGAKTGTPRGWPVEMASSVRDTVSKH